MDPQMATGGRKLEEMARLMSQMEEDGAAGEHMKAMWAGQSNVLVAVRVRPILKHDVIKKGCVRVLDSKVVVIMDPAHDKQDVLRVNRSREKHYAFDYVFEAGSSQDSVYHHTTKFLIHGVLDGFNATVFAYGNTGAGKTFTMIGSKADPGIMVRVMDDLFIYTSKNGKNQGVTFKATVSFLEVYNENIRDLLSDAEEYLDLREDPIAGPTVAGITEIEAKTSLEIMTLLHRGNEKRTQQPTAANEVSSRSHAVLQVVVECRDRAPGTVSHVKVGKLSLVDLAGSERAANTKNRGARLVEGANINRSLLALGNCINALGEKGNKGNFVPYRDSKLTRLLKDSLGGNCRTVMIANISSAESSFEETLNTLKYANRAKNIKTNVQRNVLDVNHHISEYVNLIANLRSEIKLLKDQILVQPASEFDPRRMSPGGQPRSPSGGVPPSPLQQILKQPATPLQALRESMRSAASLRGSSDGQELLMNMRQKIVENFQERMQLRRSLIELEDQNVQNSIEMSKRQLMVVQWSENELGHHVAGSSAPGLTNSIEISTAVLAHGPPEIKEALLDCEQLKKAVMKNSTMKKNIEKRLRNNERDAEKFRDELSNNITGEDRKELMELQYQVGRLELENMELEQHRIVHESIMKGKELAIQKLRLQLAMKDKIIKRQRAVLQEHGLSNKVGYGQLDAMERALMSAEADFPASPPQENHDVENIEGQSSVAVDASSRAEDLVLDVIDLEERNNRKKAGVVQGKVPPLMKKNRLLDSEQSQRKIGGLELDIDVMKGGVASRKDRKYGSKIENITSENSYQEQYAKDDIESERVIMQRHKANNVHEFEEETAAVLDDNRSHYRSKDSLGLMISAQKVSRGSRSENVMESNAVHATSDEFEDNAAERHSALLVSPRKGEKPKAIKNSGIRVGGGLQVPPAARLKGVQNRKGMSTVEEQQKWMEGGAAAGNNLENQVEQMQPHSPRAPPSNSHSSSRDRLLFAQANRHIAPVDASGRFNEYSDDNTIQEDLDVGGIAEESMDEMSVMSDMSEQSAAISTDVVKSNKGKAISSNKHKPKAKSKNEVPDNSNISQYPDLSVDGFAGFGRNPNSNPLSGQPSHRQNSKLKPFPHRPLKQQIRAASGAAIIYPSGQINDSLSMNGYGSNANGRNSNQSALPVLNSNNR